MGVLGFWHCTLLVRGDPWTDAELFQSQVERLECEVRVDCEQKTSELAGCMDLYISPEHSNQGSLPARAGRG